MLELLLELNLLRPCLEFILDPQACNDTLGNLGYTVI